MIDQDLIQVKSEMDKIVEKYKQYEDLTPNKPPATGGYWSPAYGYLKIVENQTAYDGYDGIFVRQIVIGVNIGSKFANYNKDIISALKSDVKSVLLSLVQNHGGFIIDKYGSAYSQLGWVKKT